MMFREQTQVIYDFSERFFVSNRDYFMTDIAKNTSCEGGMHSHPRKQAYYALTLIKRLGKHGGYSSQMINLLDYYLSFTKDIDWEEGGIPIVFQSLCRTSYDFCLSIRQVQRIEKALAEKGLIEWHDSPNNKRYGQRDEKGRLINAFGISLASLRSKIPVLETEIEEKHMKKEAWLSLKHSAHILRKEVRGMLHQQQGIALDDDTKAALEAPIRTNMASSKIQLIINVLTKLCNQLRKQKEKNFSNVDKNVVHKKNTKTSNISNSQSNGLGLKNITYQDISRYIYRIDKTAKIKNWQDVLDYAENNRCFYGISDKSWHKSNTIMGKVATSIAILITSNGLKKEKGRVYNPKAYFSSLVARAEKGSLFLDKSIY